MKPLALKVVSIVGLVVVTLGGCTNAYGKEILNLELLCEGNVGVELNTLDKSKDYERLFLRLLLATAIENDTIEFSERLSIQENMLGKMPLQVTETLIAADLNEFPEDLREGLLSAVDEISEIPAANFSIDRLTGKIEGRLEVKFDEKYLQGYIDEDVISGGIAKMLRAFTIEGQCKKLDLKKKLF